MIVVPDVLACDCLQFYISIQKYPDTNFLWEMIHGFEQYEPFETLAGFSIWVRVSQGQTCKMLHVIAAKIVERSDGL